MKCKVVQRRLLAITNPERIPAELRNHLAHCAACREWHNHLILLEQHIPLLPVPQSNGRAQLMRRLLQEALPRTDASSSPMKSFSEAPTLSHSRGPTLSHPQVPTTSLTSSRPPVRRRNLLLGAAALLLIALGWFGLHG
jgi:hypothetical protein